jgi:hypothetical protein
VKIKEEEVKCELHERHSDCYWVKVSKRAEKKERSPRKLDVGCGDQGGQISKVYGSRTNQIVGKATVITEWEERRDSLVKPRKRGSS